MKKKYSREVKKKKIDVAYQKSKKTSKKKRINYKRILIASIAGVGLDSCLHLSNNTSCWKSFEIWTIYIQKLVEGEFVHQLNSVVKDNEIEIKLEKAYIDQKQLGLYFHYQSS